MLTVQLMLPPAVEGEEQKSETTNGTNVSTEGATNQHTERNEQEDLKILHERDSATAENGLPPQCLT